MSDDEAPPGMEEDAAPAPLAAEQQGAPAAPSLGAPDFYAGYGAYYGQQQQQTQPQQPYPGACVRVGAWAMPCACACTPRSSSSPPLSLLLGRPNLMGGKQTGRGG